MIKELLFGEPGLPLGNEISSELVFEVIQKFDDRAQILVPGDRRKSTVEYNGNKWYFDLFVTPQGEGIVIEIPQTYIDALVGQAGTRAALSPTVPDTRRFNLADGPVYMTNMERNRLERILYSAS